ncbi:hypothetical protein Hanom_Chr07g00592251 [Helianthus anomalus]
MKKTFYSKKNVTLPGFEPIGALIRGSNLTGGEGLRNPSGTPASGEHDLMVVEEST